MAGGDGTPEEGPRAANGLIEGRGVERPRGRGRVLQGRNDFLIQAAMVGGSALFQVAMKIARNIFQGDRWHSGTIMVPLWLSIGSRLPAKIIGRGNPAAAALSARRNRPRRRSEPAAPEERRGAQDGGCLLANSFGVARMPSRRRRVRRRARWRAPGSGSGLARCRCYCKPGCSRMECRWWFRTGRSARRMWPGYR